MNRIFYDGQATQGAGGNGEMPEADLDTLKDIALERKIHFFGNVLNLESTNFIKGYLECLKDNYRRHLSPSSGLTKESVISAIEDELIEAYGGLSKDKNGKNLDTPYTVLGIVRAALVRVQSPSLPGEKGTAPKLADTIKWMSEGARRNLKNCETNLLEAHYEGYLEALEELSKEMELTPSQTIRLPSAETGEQVEGKKEALDPCVCSYAGEGSQYCTYPKCERIKEDMARMADPKAAPRLTFKEQELTPPSVEADQQVPETKPWPLHCYAPGNYQCKCAICKTSFQGDKRGVVCLECAIIQTKEFIATMYQQISTLRSSGQIVASEYQRDMEIVKGERDGLKVERDEYKKGLEDLNTELDDIWNTPAISSKVADWVIKRICYAQQKTLATLNKFTNNTKDSNHG